jgi:hypothetical protein
MGPREHSTTILLPKVTQNLSCVSLLGPGIPDCRRPCVFLKRKLPDVENSVKDDSSDHVMHSFPVVRCPGFMVVTQSFTHLSITFSNQRFSNCGPAVGFVNLMSVSFCGNRVVRMNIQFCCPLSSVLQQFCGFPKQSFSMFCDLFLSMLIFGHCSSSLMLSSHDWFCRYNLRNSRSRYS